MFKCDKCSIVSKPNEKPRRIVTEIREKLYTNKKRYGKKIVVKESKGFETVKEKMICQECSVQS